MFAKQYRVLDTGGRVCSSYTEKKKLLMLMIVYLKVIWQLTMPSSYLVIDKNLVIDQ